jgi:uncharacterized protein (DUF2062 family)
MLVNPAKKENRLSWEMSDRRLTEGAVVSAGIKVALGVAVGARDVVAVDIGVHVAVAVVVGAGVSVGSTATAVGVGVVPHPIRSSALRAASRKVVLVGLLT